MLFRRMSAAGDEGIWSSSEALYIRSRQCLGQEVGKPCLESVQARFAACLYLLQTQRPNEAWYEFGTTVQMTFVLGLHHGKGWAMQHAKLDKAAQECQKRTFWAIATLDVYLAIILGRPALINDADCSQDFPEAVDDEELLGFEAEPQTSSKRDRIIEASILHAQIARTVRKAAKEQAAVSRHIDNRRIEAATKSNKEISAWEASLPVILSGAVNTSSLVPVYRRQVTVLGLARAHALMLVNRPMLLMEPTNSTLSVQPHVRACLSAASATFDLLLSPASTESKTSLNALWFTSYVAFNAVAVVYIWLIQRARGRLVEVQPPAREEDLRLRAEEMQSYFDRQDTDAPSLRYNAVLRELRQEVQRQARRPPTRRPSVEPDLSEQGQPQLPGVPGLDQATPWLTDDLIDWDSWASDIPLDPDLWSQLETFPFGDYLGTESHGWN